MKGDDLGTRRGAHNAASTVRSRTELETFRPLVRSALLVALVFAVGVTGYLVIGGEQYGFIDAMYMTVITLTTVGFGEVIDLSNNPQGRVFTTLLLLGGVGTFLNFVSTATAFFIEGSAQHLFWRRRMSRAISDLEGHTVVCGGGYTGAHVISELHATGRPFVLIEHSDERVADLARMLGSEFPAVIGDATDDEALEAAGVERAGRLVACISNDKDNLIITVSARILNPKLRIVCRCVDERVQEKIRKAGADSVVSLSRIGGLRLVSEAVRPVAVNYLDMMLRDSEKGLRVESTRIHERSDLAGARVEDLNDRGIDRLLLLATLDDDGTWSFAPSGHTKLPAGITLVYMAPPEARRELERLAGNSD
jgi:voltage-gated potassium channel